MIKKTTYFVFCSIGLVILNYAYPIKKEKVHASSIKYERVQSWPDLPKDLKLGNPCGLYLDTSQNLVVLHRAEREWEFFRRMPSDLIQGKTILIINKDNGKLINSWGNNLFIMPHGLHIDNENNIWVTDIGLHQVFKFSYDGKLLLKLGEAKIAGNDGLHFDKPTDIVTSNDGSIFVSDGYGNSRIIKFSPFGKYLMEWGKKGNKESEFNIPHGIAIDKNDKIFVADRENNRIQIFDTKGKFIKQIESNLFGSICAVQIKKSKLFAIDDRTFLKVKHRGSDLIIFDSCGIVLTRFGRNSSKESKTTWYHDLTIDNNENLYIGDILNNTIQKFRRISDK